MSGEAYIPLADEARRPRARALVDEAVLDVRFDDTKFREVMIWGSIQLSRIGVTCLACNAYLELRARAITAFLVQNPQKDSTSRALARLIVGVHARHESGLPILPPLEVATS